MTSSPSLRRVSTQSAKLTGAFIISVDKAYTHLVNGTMSPFLSSRGRSSGGEEETDDEGEKEVEEVEEVEEEDGRGAQKSWRSGGEYSGS